MKEQFVTSNELTKWLTWAIKQVESGQCNTVSKYGWTVYRADGFARVRCTEVYTLINIGGKNEI